jgi:hypothetical protein
VENDDVPQHRLVDSTAPGTPDEGYHEPNICRKAFDVVLRRAFRVAATLFALWWVVFAGICIRRDAIPLPSDISLQFILSFVISSVVFVLTAIAIGSSSKA